MSGTVIETAVNFAHCHNEICLLTMRGKTHFAGMNSKLQLATVTHKTRLGKIVYIAPLVFHRTMNVAMSGKREQNPAHSPIAIAPHATVPPQSAITTQPGLQPQAIAPQLPPPSPTFIQPQVSVPAQSVITIEPGVAPLHSGHPHPHVLAPHTGNQFPYAGGIQLPSQPGQQATGEISTNLCSLPYPYFSR